VIKDIYIPFLHVRNKAKLALPFPTNIVMEILDSAIRQEKQKA
jgi:hypothetical protein